MIVFNRKDALQWRYVHRITRATGAAGALPAVGQRFRRSGRARPRLVPRPRVADRAGLRAGRIAIIDPQRGLDVPLYWQHAAIRSSTLQRIGRAPCEAAADALRP